VTCSGATDMAGNGAASVSASYQVHYNFTGFFSPIDNYVNNVLVKNVVKAGSAVPVKFSLGGNQGLNIFAAGYPKLGFTACVAVPADVIEEVVTNTSGGSSLSYDPTKDQYIYVWKTEKSWAGKCGILQVTLIDGTSHLAYFEFKK
jgi:hypothetical protein